MVPQSQHGGKGVAVVVGVLVLVGVGVAVGVAVGVKVAQLVDPMHAAPTTAVQVPHPPPVS